MSLVPSLLQAIVRVDGEALVMHAGDKPYVVSPTGQIELANRGLTIGAVNGIVGQLLPATFQKVLEEFGAVQYELPPIPEFPGEHFTVVAARGGDDVWTEIRRRRQVDEDRVPEELFGLSASPPAAPPLIVAAAPSLPPVMPRVSAEPAPPQVASADAPVPEPRIAPALAAPPAVVASTAEVADEKVEEQEQTFEVVDDDDVPLSYTRQFSPQERFSNASEDDDEEEIDLNAELDDETEVEAAPEPTPIAVAQAPSVAAEHTPVVIAEAPVTVARSLPVAVEPQQDQTAEAPSTVARPAPVAVEPPHVVAAEAPVAVEPPQVVTSEAHAPAAQTPIAAPEPSPAVALPPPIVAAQTPVVEPEMPVVAASSANPAPQAPFAAPRAVPPQPPANVLPILRSPIRSDQPPPPMSDSALSGLERLLRVSAARGASTLYLSSGSRPSVRVDGELQMLDGEPVHVSRDVESLLLTLMPERSHEALRTGAATEWICEIEGVGRVRCMSFRDHLGPGGVFRMMPTRPVSTDQLSLPLQVQSLAIEPEGLVLVSGSRSSGKRTLMAAFVDLMNRTRRDHIITIEREINIVHERGYSFISQREVRGDDEDMLAAARAALREDPDVLFIEDLRTGPLMNVALEAAASGHLVVGGFSAHTATGAIDRIIDLYAPEYRRQVQFALADSLRGIIVQALLRKIGGGRLAAREVLLNTPAVSSVIAEGKTSQLPMAIEGGRRYGMMPLNDALVGLVQSGAVEAREAYRHSPDRPGFLAALNRNGIDTSFVERLA